MAGTIFGLGLSQRVDTNGQPDSGWLLYLYEANTSTPVTAYQDTGLTLTLPWPIEADSSGMMPAFWLDDGSYRARGISADGSRTFFDMPSVLALGASSGGGGGGGGVDTTTIFQTGDTMFQEVAGTRSGWVRDNGRTIGSASSGASERANADCNALFLWLWNNFSDAKCPVLGGRGANASADWSANKQITLLDKRGVGVIGLDDMGNSAASSLTGVPFSDGDATTAGSICGEATHSLTSGENAQHTHTASVTDPGHGHDLTFNTGSGGAFGINATANSASTNTFSSIVQSHTTGISVTNANSGNGTAHNNVQRSIVGTWYRKL